MADLLVCEPAPPWVSVRPAAPGVNDKGVPAELKAVPQWVGWRYIFRNDKWSKPPVCCWNGKKADMTNPESWTTYEEALDAYRNGQLDGIGFVFTEEDPYTGIDLDDCRDSGTGELTPRADAIVRRLASFTEVSPSGTGVKIFVKGRPPQKTGRRRNGIEVYSQARFFTVTGLHLPDTPPTIEARQEELLRFLDDVFGRGGRPARKSTRTASIAQVQPDRTASEMEDAEVLERARGAANGEKFARLWAGDTGGYDSDSEADLALCSLLAFWVGPDAQRVAALFGQSELAKRAKWADRDDYRQGTVEKAIGGLTSSFPPMLIRGNRSNQITRSNQEYTGFLNTGRDGREGLSGELEEESVRLALDLAGTDGEKPDWVVSFTLARRLRTISREAPEPFGKAVAAFCEQTGRDFEDFWYAYLDCWPKVRFAEGEDVFAWAVGQAATTDYPFLPESYRLLVKYRTVASLAWHLARHTGESPFWLPRERIADLLGCTPMTVSRIVNLLVSDGLIECVDATFSYTQGKAKEYRFVGPSPAEDVP